MVPRIHRFVLITAVFFFSVSTAGANGGQEVNFSRFVVVGDSIAAGVQNLSLNENSQPNSYAALVAGQAGADFPLPLIYSPGVPPGLSLEDPGPPPILGLVPPPDPEQPQGRINPLFVSPNVSVPNLKMDELLTYRPTCLFDETIGGIRLVDLYTNLILGLPACLAGGPFLSEIEMAEALEPTFSIIWVGNNDTLWAAILGVTSEITAYETFKSGYEEIVQRMVATGADLVIGNLPDVLSSAFLTSAEDLSAALGINLVFLGPALGIGPGDYVTLFAFDAIKAILKGEAAGPLPDPLVVTAAEVLIIQEAGERFNAVVERTAGRYGIPVADIRGLLNDVDEKGYVVGGHRLTNNYLGGIISLDGFHPTNTGHAITANTFIKTINGAYGTSIPRIDLDAVLLEDPLVFPETGKPAKRPKD